MRSSIKQIAKQRIDILFEQANNVYQDSPELSSRYLGMARKIAMAAKIRLPINFRRRTCKNCNSLLMCGQNCRVRVRQKREPHVVITCLKCGWYTRIPLRQKKEKK